MKTCELRRLSAEQCTLRKRDAKYKRSRQHHIEMYYKYKSLHERHVLSAHNGVVANPKSAAMLVKLMAESADRINVINAKVFETQAQLRENATMYAMILDRYVFHGVVSVNCSAEFVARCVAAHAMLDLVSGSFAK
jgi:hypothetical protein